VTNPSLRAMRLLRWDRRYAAAAAVLLAWLGAAGCYRPNILDGGLLCNPADKACPDGFSCDLGTMTCVRMPGHVDAAVEVQPDATDAKDGAVDTQIACYTPKSGCVTQGGSVCDPVCGTGCACHEKCSINPLNDAVGCKMPNGNLRRKALEGCDPSGAGTAQQIDNCDNGLFCVTDMALDGCANRCRQFCRVDADCTNATCSRALGSSLKFCDVPLVTCDPVGPGARNACPGATAQGCYVSAARPNLTLCDCPLGAQVEGASCAETRECVAGLVCADSNGTGVLSCRRVCNLDSTGIACPTGTSCHAYLGSTKFGYCF
jgi:hypothetical protein